MTLAIVKVLPEPVTPKQGLEGFALPQAIDQLGNGSGLVARGRKRLAQLERGAGEGDERFRVGGWHHAAGLSVR